MNQLSLSEECLSYIDSLDTDYGQQYPSEEDRKNTDLLREIIRRVIKSREGFTGEKIDEVIEQLVKITPEFFVGEIDDFLTRFLLQEVSGMAKRLVRLSRLDALRQPSRSTAMYIREAVHTYLYGLPQASAAISRAALEQALKESLGKQGGGEFIKFQDLVEEARKWKILDATTALMARDTAKKADAVLHERPTDHNGALEVLTEVRGLLEQIYSARGEF
jgi:hypothetical protein